MLYPAELWAVTARGWHGPAALRCECTTARICLTKSGRLGAISAGKYLPVRQLTTWLPAAVAPIAVNPTEPQ